MRLVDWPLIRWFFNMGIDRRKPSRAGRAAKAARRAAHKAERRARKRARAFAR